MANFLKGFAQTFGPQLERGISRKQRLDDILAAQTRQDQLLADQIARQDARHTILDDRYKAEQAEAKRRWDEQQRLEKQARERVERNRMEGLMATLGAGGPEIEEQAMMGVGGAKIQGDMGEARTLDSSQLDSPTAARASKAAKVLLDKRIADEAARRAQEAKLDPKWTAPTTSDAMSPSQRRIRDLLKVMNPDAAEKELAQKEWEHYERKGLSATDKGASDIVKVFEKWQKASALIDEQEAKGEKPTPDELRQFAVYELEIQDHYGKRGRKVPGALLETMKKVWRFPTATVEGPVLGGQEIALAGEELVRDLDYLVKTIGQDRLDEHVGLWDETEDAIIKKLFPPGTSMTDKEFQAIQKFKQVYSGLSNKTLYLRSGATVTEQEWNRLKKEIGVPDSADFYNRIRTFAKKERRDTKRLLQTRIKARYIFPDELQQEIMGGLTPTRPKEPGLIPALPQGELEEVKPQPLDPTPTEPQKLSAADSVELEGLVNKGVPNLSPSEKIKLKELLRNQLNK